MVIIIFLHWRQCCLNYPELQSLLEGPEVTHEDSKHPQRKRVQLVSMTGKDACRTEQNQVLVRSIKILKSEEYHILQGSAACDSRATCGFLNHLQRFLIVAKMNIKSYIMYNNCPVQYPVSLYLIHIAIAINIHL